MKLIYTFALILVFASCKNAETPNEKTNLAVAKDSVSTTTQPNLHSFVSSIRPNEKIELNKEYVNELVYNDFNENGDYPLISFLKNSTEWYSLHYDAEKFNFDKLQFNKGDVMQITWKIDSVWIAGEGDKLEMAEWLVNIKKIKDGKVSLFKKNYKKELNIIYEKEFTKDGMDYIYKTIQYYLANTTNELVKTNLNNKNANLVFMIESDFERNKEIYTHIGIATSHENHTQVFQWLFLSEDEELFEYDLPNDKLIKFE